MGGCIDWAANVINELDPDIFRIYKSGNEFVIVHPLVAGMSIVIRGICLEEGRGLAVIGEGYGVLSSFENILQEKSVIFYRMLLTLGFNSIIYPVLGPAGELFLIPAKEIVLHAETGDGADSSEDALKAILVNFLKIALWLEANYEALLKDEEPIPYDDKVVEDIVKNRKDKMKNMPRGPISFI